MSRLIQFYFRETRGFVMLLIGFYILFDIMIIISKKISGLPGLGLVILTIIMIIYLIKFN